MHKDGQINLILFEEHFLRLCRYASFGIHKDKEKHIKISKCGSHLVLEHIIANEMKRKTVSSLLTRQWISSKNIFIVHNMWNDLSGCDTVVWKSRLWNSNETGRLFRMSVLGSYQGCLPNVIIKVNQKGFAKTNIRLGSEHLETRWSLTAKRRTPFLQNRWNGS